MSAIKKKISKFIVSILVLTALPQKSDGAAERTTGCRNRGSSSGGDGSSGSSSNSTSRSAFAVKIREWSAWQYSGGYVNKLNDDVKELVPRDSREIEPFIELSVNHFVRCCFFPCRVKSLFLLAKRDNRPGLSAQ